MTTALEPREQPTRGQTRWAPQELPRWRPFTPSAQGEPAAADAAICTGTTAVIAPQRPLAIGALRKFAERGIRAPTDVSVVGFDDIFGIHLKQPTAPNTIGTARSRRCTAVDLVLSRYKYPVGPRRSNSGTRAPDDPRIHWPPASASPVSECGSRHGCSSVKRVVQSGGATEPRTSANNPSDRHSIDLAHRRREAIGAL